MAPLELNANILPIIKPVLLVGALATARFVIMGETIPTNKLGRKKRPALDKSIKVMISNLLVFRDTKLPIKKSIEILETDDKVKAMPTLFNCVSVAAKIVVNFPPIQCPIDNPANTTAITDVHV